MHIIKNYDALATSENRKIVLDLIEEAFLSIQPQEVLAKNITLQNNILSLSDQHYTLDDYERIFVVGFGKGSEGVCKFLETALQDKLTEGYVIDVVDETFEKIHFTKGTHPLPSSENITFTQNVLSHMQGLSEKDLVLVVICGGGSVMFEAPYSVDLETLTKTVKALLRSGATISEMNVIRKHLSKVKGGNFAKLLYPATIASIIFSDVPGNDLSVIASGPTVKDTTTLEDVQQILQKYNIEADVTLPSNAFTSTATDEKYFEHVNNILLVSNLTALHAMQQKAESLGKKAGIYSDHVQGDARTLGKTLIDAAQKGEIMLAGGESTIKITGNGKGGRNQALVLSTLSFLSDGTILASFDSDGWDFYALAGAIADETTLQKATQLQVNPQEYLADDDSYGFFEKIGDGILTDKLPSNVSDLYIVFKP